MGTTTEQRQTIEDGENLAAALSALTQLVADLRAVPASVYWQERLRDAEAWLEVARQIVFRHRLAQHVVAGGSQARSVMSAEVLATLECIAQNITDAQPLIAALRVLLAAEGRKDDRKDS